MSREFKVGISTPSVVLDDLALQAAARSVVWNADEATVDLGLTANLQHHVGQQVLYAVTNNSGASISKGKLVSATGTIGNSGRITIGLSDADGSSDSQYIMGVVAETIANGADGYVVHFGKVRGLNTNSWTEGTVLYADPAAAGGLTSTRPVAPNNIVTIAIVVTQSATVGELFVRPTYGSNINNDEGVLITTPSDGQVLTYDSASSLWKNESPSGGGSTFTFSSGAPSSPEPGDHWVDSDTGIMYIRLNDGNTSQWFEASAVGAVGPTGPTGATGATGAKGDKGDTGDPGITVSATAPSSPALNQLWLDTS